MPLSSLPLFNEEALSRLLLVKLVFESRVLVPLRGGRGGLLALLLLCLRVGGTGAGDAPCPFG